MAHSPPTVVVPQMKIVHSLSRNPYLNLALEEHLLGKLERDERILFLWWNSPCVVLGRFQNPWMECDVEWLEKENIPVVRRRSGGGTVYHDLGNLCFSLLSHPTHFSREQNGAFLLDVGRGLGEHHDLSFSLSSRGDLLLNNQFKVSGQAYQQKKDFYLHHGTFLVKSDLIHLKSALTPHYNKLVGPKVRSHPSPVTNLCEFIPSLTVEGLRDHLGERFLAFFAPGNDSVIHINHYSEDELLQDKKIKKSFDSLSSHEWIWWETPAFQHHWSIPGTKERGIFFIEKGMIVKCEWESERIHPAALTILCHYFEGTSYGQKSIEEKLFRYSENKEVNSIKEVYANDILLIEQEWKRNIFGEVEF